MSFLKIFGKRTLAAFLATTMLATSLATTALAFEQTSPDQQNQQIQQELPDGTDPLNPSSEGEGNEADPLENYGEAEANNIIQGITEATGLDDGDSTEIDNINENAGETLDGDDTAQTHDHSHPEEEVIGGGEPYDGPVNLPTKSMSFKGAGAQTFGVSTTPSVTIDPSDLSDWYVYDSYYNANWTGVSNTVHTTPQGWTNGKHPFSYYKETSIGFNQFIDFNSPTGYDDFVRVVLNGTIRSDGAYQTAHFSNHIFTTGGKNDAAIHFLGYGVDGRTDFAITDITDPRVKTIGFDIDINGIFAHAMNGFGILVNAGVDTSGMLKAYAVYLKYNASVPSNSTMYLVDISKGTDAFKLHLANPASMLSLPNTTLTSVDLSKAANPTGKKRVDIEFNQTDMKIKVSTYTSGSSMKTDYTSSNLTMTSNTGFQGFGPFIDHTSHGCTGLTYMTFSGVVCSVNYSVLFDNNFEGQTTGIVPANVERVDDLEPDAPFGAENMPSDPYREGYVFDGWYTTDGVPFNGDSIVNGTQTVYAKWLREFKISYDFTGNGSLSGANDELVLDGKGLVSLPTATADTNHEFKGWIVDGNTSKYYTDAEIQNLPITSDTKITAVFKEQPKVTFESGANGSLDGGNVTIHVPTSGQLESADVIPNTVADKNYEFVGWKVKGDSTSTLYTKEEILAQAITGDITFEAVFKKIKNGVNYEVTEGGKITDGTTQYPNAELGDLLTVYPRPKVEPADHTFEFIGWVDKNGDPIDPDKDEVSMDTSSVTAVFEKKESFTFTFSVKPEDSAKGSIADPSEFTIYKSAGQDAFAGDAENFAIPNVNPESNFVFYGWEDKNGNVIDAADIAGMKITADTKIYARFEEDNDGDGCADKDQTVITIKFASDSTNSGTVSTPDTFQILQRTDGNPTLLKDALTYGPNAFAAVPGVTAKKGFAFDTWLDPDGNEVADPSSIDLNQFISIGGSNALTFKAVFETDENGDNIPDKHQWLYTLTFNADPAKFVFTNMTGSSKVYRFMGGDKRVDSSTPPTLGLANLIGGAASYKVPEAGKKAGNSEFNPGAWEFKDGSSLANIKDPKLNQSTEYTMGEIPNYYTVIFIENGVQKSKLENMTNAQQVKDVSPDYAPAAKIGTKTFTNWVGSDGKTYTHDQILQYNPTRDITFTAQYKSGISIKL